MCHLRLGKAMVYKETYISGRIVCLSAIYFRILGLNNTFECSIIWQLLLHD